MHPEEISSGPGVERLLAEQAAELPQKDELCGPFWGLVALRAAGVRTDPNGEQLDQDAVAAVAGTRLSPPRSRSRPLGEPAREDYRIELPVDADDPGTAAAGLAHAIGELSAGRLVVVPVAGDWRVERLLALIESVWRASVTPVAIIANLHTGKLWPANTSGVECSHYLDDGRHETLQSDWSVGHFVALTALQRGNRGTLVGVADTYRSRGEHGRHRQPVERIVSALRGDDKPRGLLIVVRAESEQRARESVANAGLEVRFWDSFTRDELRVGDLLDRAVP